MKTLITFILFGFLVFYPQAKENNCFDSIDPGIISIPYNQGSQDRYQFFDTLKEALEFINSQDSPYIELYKVDLIPLKHTEEVKERTVKDHINRWEIKK